MTGYLLDTNVISELRKTKPHGGVVTWLSEFREEQLYLSVVTMGELQAGVERIRHHDSSKAEEIEAWVDQLAESGQVLPMDTKCFREWGRLMEGKPDGLMEDAMIAATARVHDLVIATRNERVFKRLEVRVLNPYAAR